VKINIHVNYFLKNRSEFLLHLTRFEAFSIDDFKTPIIQVKDHQLEVIKPRLDFRENFDIDTQSDLQLSYYVLFIRLNLFMTMIWKTKWI